LEACSSLRNKSILNLIDKYIDMRLAKRNAAIFPKAAFCDNSISIRLTTSREKADREDIYYAQKRVIIPLYDHSP